LQLTQEDLTGRVLASPALLRSLDAHDVDVLVGRVGRSAEGTWQPRTHVMWLTAEPGYAVPLEALAFLLAGSLARQFNEYAAVAVLRDDGIDLSVWNPDLFVDEPLLPSPHTLDGVLTVLANLGIPYAHVLVIHPDRPHELPPSFADMRFHRAVVLMRRVPANPPEFATAQLVPEVVTPPEDGSVPYFCSVVPTVFVPRAGAERAIDLVTERVRIDEHDPLYDPNAPDDLSNTQRMRRDHCRLRIDLEDLARRWDAQPGSTVAVPALLADATLASSLDRWARAVTNRRVGLALSGGGASIYRVIPLLERLAEANVPIDVVSGVSGGALLGAYFCKDGVRGAHLCAKRGYRFQLGVLMSLIDVTPFQRLIDNDLDYTTLDELEVTFVPLATALQANMPPQAHAVVAGTLGRAVRVSGAMPVLFAPTDNGNIRYADGATSIPVPARALAQYGADMVIACNAVPGPNQRNPLSGWLIGDFLYRCTPLGRFVDLWVATSSLLQRVSREATEDAHVFIEVGNTRSPLVESFYFYDAEGIVAEARLDEELVKGARVCAREWEEFALRGSR
jgi:predicted acylesterase/phospholipase RssA